MQPVPAATGVLYEDHPQSGRHADRAGARRKLPRPAGLQPCGTQGAALGRPPRVLKTPRRRVGARLPSSLVPVATPGDAHPTRVVAVASLPGHRVPLAQARPTRVEAPALQATTPTVLPALLTEGPVVRPRVRRPRLRLARAEPAS